MSASLAAVKRALKAFDYPSNVLRLKRRSPDQTFEILINDESARTGSLLEDFDPAVNPPAEIGTLAYRLSCRHANLILHRR